MTKLTEQEIYDQLTEWIDRLDEIDLSEDEIRDLRIALLSVIASIPNRLELFINRKRR